MPNETVEKLEAQMKALEERLKRVKAREAERERKVTNKRRYLLGAMLEAWMDEDAAMQDDVRQRLDRFLTRASDRKYFGMAPKGDAESSGSDGDVTAA